MANITENIFRSLKKMFSGDIVVRKIGDRRYKTIDVHNYETMGKLATNYLTTKYNGLYSSTSQTSYGFNPGVSTTATRLNLFRDYEFMEQDPIISSALDLYSEESALKNEFGQVLTISSENKEIQDILNNLFYDILNLDFNLQLWIRNLVKYGDWFMKLEIAERIGVVSVLPISTYQVTRQEGDANDPNRISFKIEGENKLIGNELENYEMVHFRLLNDSNFLPYGKSMIESARRIWKQLALMEDAMLIHRIMRAPQKRIFKIDVGNIHPNDIDGFMQKIIDQVKKIPYIDKNTGDYNLKYNMQNITEDFYLPLRSGDTGTTIETLDGLEYQAIEDIEYLRNKLMAALRIPKAFLGYEEGLNSKCLHPDTKIPSLDGNIYTIEEISNKFKDDKNTDMWVYSFDFETNEVIPTKVKIAEKTRKNAELVRVHLDNNTHIDCTPDHHLILSNGTEIEAQQLKENDSLKIIKRRNKKIAKSSNEYEQIYQPSTKTWVWTHKLVDEYINRKIKNNGCVNEKFDKNSLTVIHHEDFSKFNNSLNNLKRMRWDEHIKLNDFIEISSHYNTVNDFNIWKNEYLGTNYNHKVTKIEFLDEKIDTYNMEVDNINHNYLLDNGVVIKNSTLAAEDVRFARTIEKIQKVVEHELTKIAIIHLYVQGFEGEELLNFDLKLTSPSVVSEQEKLELWTSRIELADRIKEQKLLSSDWIYQNIYNVNDNERKEEKDKVLEDLKLEYRQEQIKMEGNDPAVSGQHVDDDGTVRGVDEPDEIYYDANSDNSESDNSDNISSDNNDDSTEPYKKNDVGRPKNVNKTYSTDKHVLGRDPIGKKDNKSPLKLSKNYTKSKPLSKESMKKLKKKFRKNKSNIIKEELLNGNIKDMIEDE